MMMNTDEANPKSFSSLEEWKKAKDRERARNLTDSIDVYSTDIDFRDNEPEATQYNLDYGATRKKADLKKGVESEQIRDYMVQRFGADYDRAGGVSNDDMVEDFFGHMRSVNTNALYTAGEARYVYKASEGDKETMGNAYKLYDSVGNVFVNDGVWGAADGIKDYIFAAAKDPSNYLGFLTGGIAKGASMGVSATGRALIKKAIAEASAAAAKNASSPAALKLAGKVAGERMISKLVTAGIKQKSPVAKEMMRAAVKREKEIFLQEQMLRATNKITREVRADGAKKALKLSASQRGSLSLADELLGGGVKGSIYQTAVLDGTVAALQDYHLQRNILLPIGAQDNYSALQTGFSSLLGSVGASLQLAGRGTKGASGYGGYKDVADIQTIRLDATNKEMLLLKGAPQKEARRQIKESTIAWREKVERGEILNDNNTKDISVPLLRHIILGEDGTGKTGGLLKVFSDNGIRWDRKTPIGDIMTSVARIMPQKELDEINKLMKPGGLTLGITTQMGERLEALLASKWHSSGQSLQLLAQIAKTTDAAILRGEDILNSAGRSATKKERKAAGEALYPEVKKGKAAAARSEGWTAADISNGLQYGQNVWRRLLVSSPKTTAVNVMGFGSYAVLNTVTDTFQAVGHLGMGSLKWLGDEATAANHFKAVKVHGQMMSQKLKNLMDPLTTQEAYLSFLEQHSDAKKLLRETYLGGVERSAKRFGIDPQNPAFKITEAIADGASSIAGVRAQDTLTKSLMMMTELDKNLRLKHNVTFREIIEGTADAKLIDRDIVGRSMDTTLKSVFSKDYTVDDQLLKSLAKGIESFSNIPVIGTILPFGRFFNNVLGTSWQLSFGAVVGAAKAVGKGAAGVKGAGDEFIQYAARGMTGLTAVGLAMQFDQSSKEIGLPWHQRLINGHIVDFKNVFPISTFMNVGRMANNYYDEGSIPKENITDLLQQVAVGQFAKDIEFSNDLVRIVDALLPKQGDFGNQEGTRELLRILGKSGGNVLAGVTRPLDALNTMVGAMEDTDAARNIRLETGFGTFTQASTKYVDNIVQHFTDKLDSITGEELKVATREGAIRGPEPLLGLFGIKIVPGRTSSEIAYGFTEQFAYKANSRTKSAEYDNILNQFVAPKMDRAARALRTDKRFINGDLTFQRTMAKKVFGSIFTDARKDIDRGLAGKEGVLSSMQRKVKSIPSEIRAKSMAAFKERFPDFAGGIDDLSFNELTWIIQYAAYYKNVFVPG